MSVLGRDGDDYGPPAQGSSQRVADSSSSSNHPTTITSSSSRPDQVQSEDSLSHESPAIGQPRRARGVDRRSKSVGRSTQTSLDPQVPSTSSSDDTSRWWGKLWGGSNPTEQQEASDDETSSQYQPLEAPEGGSPSPGTLVSSAISQMTVTVEDRLKQDCPFFYQGIQDIPQTDRRGLQPLVSALRHSRLLSTAEGARFRACYERLNQDLTLIDTDDLFLDEPVSSDRNTIRMESSSSTRISQNTGKLSTLFFEQDGRLLMKLPRDQVRLIMDPDLKPGIISVEQWRKEDRTLLDSVTTFVGDDEEEGGMPILEDPDHYIPTRKKEVLPELRYVMTVPDDLYRRVVAEMSYALMPPWWGCFMCCSESEGRADIKLALALLSVILLLMFISTMEWPTN